jgi:hypothetical protein
MMEDFFKATGTIERILEPSTFELSGKLNSTQVFSILTDTKDPKEISFTVFNNSLDMLLGLIPGDKVSLSFEMSSKFSNGKFYNNNKCVALRKSN